MTPEQIRSARTALGMSIRQFANALKLQGKDAPRRIRRFENGELTPGQDTERRISEFMASKSTS